MSKKLLAIIGVVLCMSLVGCSSKPYNDNLEKFAQDNGTVCSVDTEGYTHVNGMIDVNSVTVNDVYIELWHFDSKASASSWRSDLESTLEINDEVQKINGGYMIFNEYYKVVQDGSYCVYAKGSEQAIVDSTIKALGIK